jgi:hypothetical protein
MGIVAVAFIVYSLVDCALAPRSRVRALPKPLWIVLILVLPVIGGILWFAIGKVRRSAIVAKAPGRAPDDDPAFLRRLAEDAEREERIRQLEEQLSQLDGDGPERKSPKNSPERPNGTERTSGADGTNGTDRKKNGADRTNPDVTRPDGTRPDAKD